MQVAVTLRSSCLLFILNTRKQLSKHLNSAAAAALLPCYCRACLNSGAEHDLLFWRCINEKQEYIEDQCLYMQTSAANTIVQAGSCLMPVLGCPLVNNLMTQWGLLHTAISIVFKLCDGLSWPNHCPEVLEADCIIEKWHKHQKAPQKPDWKVI